ncbi:hypothetical protein DFJ74DRAFT_654305 [Hyaloraphidium curvatum]|nr:hypothetical protein DFJ74DRAFT_654305 [Hyaloraphidium curvatum]
MRSPSGRPRKNLLAQLIFLGLFFLALAHHVGAAVVGTLARERTGYDSPVVGARQSPLGDQRPLLGQVAGDLYAPNVSLCPPLAPRTSPPTSIHDLRIDDFRVIAGLGDSITAAFGAAGKADSPFDIANTYENRGRSFSVGGDPGAITLPNLIHHFRGTRGLIGPSRGDHLAEFCWGILCPGWTVRPGKDHFNAALSGAVTGNINTELDYLIPAIRMDHDVDVDRDWKLITLFVMSNDLCLGCTLLRGFLSPDSFEGYIRAALERIRLELPRTVVVLMSGLNVSKIFEMTKDQPVCKEALSGGRFECACAFDPDPISGPKRRAEMDLLASAYNQRLRSIVLDYQGNVPPTEDFAVILEPGFEQTDLRSWPIQLVSTLDCFHPSLLAHAMMAEMLFNNLQRPLSEKRTRADPEGAGGVLCPTADGRVWTK